MDWIFMGVCMERLLYYEKRSGTRGKFTLSTRALQAQRPWKCRQPGDLDWRNCHGGNTKRQRNTARDSQNEPRIVQSRLRGFQDFSGEIHTIQRLGFRR